MTVVVRWLLTFLLWCLLISGGRLIPTPVVQAGNNQCDGTPYAGCETNRCCNDFVGLGVDDCTFNAQGVCVSTTTSTYTIPCDGSCTAIEPFPARANHPRFWVGEGNAFAYPFFAGRQTAKMRSARQLRANT